MNADAIVNDFATYIALAAVVPAILTTALYGFGSPWYLSWLGRVVFAQWLSIVIVFAVVLGRRVFGEYPGYGYVAVAAYSLLFLAYWALFVIVLIERRGPAATTQRKARRMSHVEVTTRTVPEIWYASKRVIRTVLVNLVVILPVVNVSLPLAVDAFTGEGVPVEVTVLVNSIVVGILVVTGILTRIIAIPAVNAWLTKLGAGSVPKSAVENGLVVPTGGAPLLGK